MPRQPCCYIFRLLSALCVFRRHSVTALAIRSFKASVPMSTRSTRPAILRIALNCHRIVDRQDQPGRSAPELLVEVYNGAAECDPGPGLYGCVDLLVCGALAGIYMAPQPANDWCEATRATNLFSPAHHFSNTWVPGHKGRSLTGGFCERDGKPVCNRLALHVVERCQDEGLDAVSEIGSFHLEVGQTQLTFLIGELGPVERAGISRAKAEGKYRGRQPMARAQTTAVIDLFRQGVTPTEIAKRLGIGRASAYRIVKDLVNTAG
jgi:Homeodomain-like domain